MPEGINYSSDDDVSLPQLNESNRDELEIRIVQARADIADFNRNFAQLKVNFPVEVEQIESAFPGLIDTITELNRGVDQEFNALSNDEIIRRIQRYNLMIDIINSVFNNLLNPVVGDVTQTVDALLETGQYSGIASNMSEEQRVALESYTQSVMESMFPESTVSRVVRGISGEYTDSFDRETGEYAELAGWQRIAIAPAEGIERIVTGIAQFADIETYGEIQRGLATLPNITGTDIVNIFRLLHSAWEHSSGIDKAAKLIAIASACVFLAGLIGTVRLPSQLNFILDGALTVGINQNLLRIVPAAAIGGLGIRNIDTLDLITGPQQY
jgi:hypothetical protein